MKLKNKAWLIYFFLLITLLAVLKTQWRSSEKRPFVIYEKGPSGYFADEFYYKYITADGNVGERYDVREYAIGDTIK